ncbi:hypothetical protein IC582_029328 [Cucumis melo]
MFTTCVPSPYFSACPASRLFLVKGFNFFRILRSLHSLTFSLPSFSILILTKKKKKLTNLRFILLLFERKKAKEGIYIEYLKRVQIFIMFSMIAFVTNMYEADGSLPKS